MKEGSVGVAGILNGGGELGAGENAGPESFKGVIDGRDVKEA